METSPLQTTPDLFARIAQRVQGDTLEIPVLPQVAMQVMTLLSGDNSNARELSALVHQDPALVARVLSTANSAAFAGRVPMVSLQQAIARIGQNILSEIAITSSLGASVFAAGGQQTYQEQLWARAVGTGAWAKEIARTRRQGVETAFLCGLLRDVGAPVVVREAVVVAQEIGAVLDDQILDTVVSEHSITAGAALAHNWGLPPTVVESIAFANLPLAAPNHIDEVATAALAAEMHALFIESESDAAAVIESPLCEVLNLYPDEMELLLQRQEKVEAFIGAMV